MAKCYQDMELTDKVEILKSDENNIANLGRSRWYIN